MRGAGRKILAVITAASTALGMFWGLRTLEECRKEQRERAAFLPETAFERARAERFGRGWLEETARLRPSPAALAGSCWAQAPSLRQSSTASAQNGEESQAKEQPLAQQEEKPADGKPEEAQKEPGKNGGKSTKKPESAAPAGEKQAEDEMEGGADETYVRVYPEDVTFVAVD